MSQILETTAGDMALEAVELAVGERTYSILHTGAVISRDEEVAFLLGKEATPRPYGAMLWPAAIALAHEVASRPVAGMRVLELGAGTGLPGIVAAGLGARVVQTDRQKLALHLCKENAARNRIATIEHRVADWTEWTDTERYDLILGSDILYAPALHARLRHIFEVNLAPGGTVLVSDPFREASITVLQAMETAGWSVVMDKWSVGVAPPPRDVGVFALRLASEP